MLRMMWLSAPAARNKTRVRGPEPPPNEKCERFLTLPRDFMWDDYMRIVKNAAEDGVETAALGVVGFFLCQNRPSDYFAD